MKKAIYATLALFICILLYVAFIAERTPIHEVKYENGKVVPKTK
jgi:hypothetical protein